MNEHRWKRIFDTDDPTGTIWQCQRCQISVFSSDPPNKINLSTFTNFFEDCNIMTVMGIMEK